MLPSPRMFAVFMAGMTLTAMRGYSISEGSSQSEFEMSALFSLGLTLLIACVPWELIRRLQKLNKKYANG